MKRALHTVALLSVAYLALSTSAGNLQDEVRGLMGSMGPKKGVTSVSVRDADGKEVVNIVGDQPLMPASNQKLLTTGTALRLLGPDFAFQTRLLRNGDRLTVVGDGDPAFADPELLAQMTYTDATGEQHTGMTVEALLALWTDAAKAAGARYAALSTFTATAKEAPRRPHVALNTTPMPPSSGCAPASGVSAAHESAPGAGADGSPPRRRAPSESM
jgi:D-alanyl-D-alanine carboxypeptidase